MYSDQAGIAGIAKRVAVRGHDVTCGTRANSAGSRHDLIDALIHVDPRRSTSSSTSSSTSIHVLVHVLVHDLIDVLVHVHVHVLVHFVLALLWRRRRPVWPLWRRSWTAPARCVRGPVACAQGAGADGPLAPSPRCPRPDVRSSSRHARLDGPPRRQMLRVQPSAAALSLPPKRVLITGAAGQIAYSLIQCVAPHPTPERPCPRARVCL